MMCQVQEASRHRFSVQYGFPCTTVCLVGNQLPKYGTIHREALDLISQKYVVYRRIN